MLIDEIELRHNQINRYRSHKRREHSQHKGGFHHGFTGPETESGHTVRGKYSQNRTENTAHRSDKKRIQKPLRIVIHIGVGKQSGKGIETETFGEKAVERIDRAGLRERRHYQPKTREKEHERHYYEYAIGNEYVQHFFCLGQSDFIFIFIHLNVSSCLYEGESI